ncbi:MULTISPECIES: glycerol-3-phosphate dehydrogenase [unclassified Sphingobium]|uniref:glycerol-3-phosphate dehydrogenase n=1 Tax=unclassified Sphingobium TaxID=2611147 RepID=UPI002225457A|nr:MULTISPECIES: glycerol-3-phosphate dehydrogenase [unclassified Sphingobium]MCW2413560.1 glycerol-3-phosphate dehydrogenase [Sphingobium sp. B8D3D]MCW2414139.1 glycerol-3-phosphate dehydrogenase [Sphingobium sp. B8D3A]
MAIEYDVLVVGGGINGAAIARDAAGRGARVMLVEQDDLAAHTSSASTKLIHGGLRYLEQYEFRLVAKALAERERLMRAAPHLIRPLEFVLPHDRGMRPMWMMRIGLFLYDRLGGRSSLPHSRAIRLAGDGYGSAIQSRFGRGYVYADCWGDDSRLVVANAQDAAEHGATILTHTKCLAAQRDQHGWRVSLQGTDGTPFSVTAHVLVNATGSWAADFLPERAGVAGAGTLRLIKGSHIVTRKLYEGDHAYILQNPDKRIVFAIPYENDFTLIGTTDVEWQGAPDVVTIDAAETDYLCDSVNRWFATQITPQDVIWSFAGVRPLYDDATTNASEISRDYVLSLDHAGGAAPVMSVFGGKITTHRALAEEVMDKLARHLPSLRPAWTATAPLPGGDLGAGGLDGLIAGLREKVGFLGETTIRRLAESYGSRIFKLLAGVKTADDLGQHFGAGLTQTEVDYLLTHEWARSVDDIVWRRSKLGLHMRREEVAVLEAYLADHARVDVNAVG